jgi:hypothetical protein
MIAPVRFDVARFLAANEFWAAVDFERVPARYRQAARDYLRHGIVPDGPLRLLLEGDVSCVQAFRHDLLGLSALADWLHELPASCWGNRDQVQCWSTFVSTRRTQLAALADMDADARQQAERLQQPEDQHDDHDHARDALERRVDR